MISADEITANHYYLTLLRPQLWHVSKEIRVITSFHDDGLVKMFILANLLKWNLLRMIEGRIRSPLEIQQEPLSFSWEEEKSFSFLRR